MKFVWLSLVAVIVVVTTGCWYLIKGATFESQVSLYARYFPQVVTRAIQLRELGTIGVPKEYRQRSKYPQTAALSRVRDKLPPWNGGENVGCELDLDFPVVNLRERYPTWGVLISHSPMRFAVLFSGSAPDLSPFLGDVQNSELLGPATRFGDPAPQLNETGSLPNGVDLSRDHERILHIFPTGVAWEAVECDAFSYILFRERDG